MAQWVASANSLGHRYIDDPRVDEAARIGQLLMAERARRDDEAARREAMAFQAQQAAERTRQFDAELARRDAEFGARQDAEAFNQFQWLAGQDTAAIERQRQQDNADRLFAAQRAEADRGYGLEREREDRLREAALFARRKAEDPVEVQRSQEEAALRLDLLRQQLQTMKDAPEQARLDDERALARARAVEEIQAEVQGKAEAGRMERARKEIAAEQARAEAKAAAEQAKADAEARTRSAYGVRGAAQGFLQDLAAAKLPSFKAGARVSTSERQKVEAALLPLIEQAFLGGGESLDPIRGGKRPGWAPSSPQEEAALAEALRRVLAERFPAMSRGSWWNPFDDETAVPFFDTDPVAAVQSRWGSALFAPR